MAKKTVINALKAACAEIGAEMKKTSCDLFIVERDNIDYFFDVDWKNYSNYRKWSGTGRTG